MNESSRCQCDCECQSRRSRCWVSHSGQWVSQSFNHSMILTEWITWIKLNEWMVHESRSLSDEWADWLSHSLSNSPDSVMSQVYFTQFTSLTQSLSLEVRTWPGCDCECESTSDWFIQWVEWQRGRLQPHISSLVDDQLSWRWVVTETETQAQ